jgi:hypothetical protein
LLAHPPPLKRAVQLFGLLILSFSFHTRAPPSAAALTRRTHCNAVPPAFAFTACLHTYLRCSDIAAVRVRGLKNAGFKDKAAGGWQGSDLSELGQQTQEEEDLDVAQGVSHDFCSFPPPSPSFACGAECGSHAAAPNYFIDRVYLNAPKQLQVRQSARAWWPLALALFCARSLCHVTAVAFAVTPHSFTAPSWLALASTFLKVILSQTRCDHRARSAFMHWSLRISFILIPRQFLPFV